MKNEKEWLVSDKTCKGCMYYSRLAAAGKDSPRCCDYTYLTGKVRQNPPRTCEVKQKGKRPQNRLSTTGCVVHRSRYTKPYIHCPV